jgi:hypothetical protein
VAVVCARSNDTAEPLEGQYSTNDAEMLFLLRTTLATDFNPMVFKELKTYEAATQDKWYFIGYILAALRGPVLAFAVRGFA